MRIRVLWVVLGLSSWGMGCGILPGEDGTACPAVVVSARPAGGGACREFGDPCQVPDGFVTCCSPSNGSCFSGDQCVDDPLDACDPGSGGTNCQHICR